MRFRLRMGLYVQKVGKLLQTLPVVILHPKDLIELNRIHYSKTTSILSWGSEECIASGLHEDELSLLKKIPQTSGHILVLGMGGGREAIALSKMGYKITGIDFIPEMIQQANINAKKNNAAIKCLIQNIASLDFQKNTFDIAWLSSAMYSSIPSQKKRIEMLNRINHSLKPGGFFLLQFQWRPREKYFKKSELFKKIFAYLTFGNYWYEEGDSIWFKTDFVHEFPSLEAPKPEFIAGGFEIITIDEINNMRGGVILRKPTRN